MNPNQASRNHRNSAVRLGQSAVLCLLLVLVPRVVLSQEPADDDEQGAWAEAKALYEKAREKAQSMGETLPDKVPEWIKDDLRNAGAWQYRVVEVPLTELEVRLNELGADRWECFSVEDRGKKARLVLKRRKRSQLREIQSLSADDLLIVLKLLKNRGESSESPP